MTTTVAARSRRVEHGGLQRSGAKRHFVQHEVPPWHGWKYSQEWRRIVRWIESMLIQPIGVGAGEPMRLARFQRDLLRRVCDSLASFVSIPAGNGKTTLMAAVALERLCRGDDYVAVDVLATKEDQARRLVDASVQMLESTPELLPLFEFYRHHSILEYRPTGSRMTAHPARLSAVQGLNSDLALIDEIGMVGPEFVTSMVARLGKKPGQRVVGFGTPGFDHDNMLETLRRMSRAGELPAGVAFIEYAADAGCAIDDERQWRVANPAIQAGFLDPGSLPLKAAIMPEFEFRSYHLGQPVESTGLWLPHGAWDGCFRQAAPPDGSAVVLAVWGSYKRQVAVVGCSLDGGVFFGWSGGSPTDAELGGVLRAACEQWDVVEVTHKPHLRLGLMALLEDEGLPVRAWPHDVATDVDSSAAFYQAIAEQTVAHDGDELLAEQVGRLTAKIDRQGNPRLVDSADEDVSAALGARAAWWRAREIALSEPTAELAIY